MNIVGLRGKSFWKRKDMRLYGTTAKGLSYRIERSIIQPNRRNDGLLNRAIVNLPRNKFAPQPEPWKLCDGIHYLALPQEGWCDVYGWLAASYLPDAGAIVIKALTAQGACDPSRRGIGSALLEALLEDAQHAQVAQVLLYSLPDATHFYHRHGFKNTYTTDPFVLQFRVGSGYQLSPYCRKN
jgi:GNAT superfamily N-acetyltransferase